MNGLLDYQGRIEQSRVCETGEANEAKKAKDKAGWNRRSQRTQRVGGVDSAHGSPFRRGAFIGWRTLGVSKGGPVARSPGMKENPLPPSDGAFREMRRPSLHRPPRACPRTPASTNRASPSCPLRRWLRLSRKLGSVKTAFPPRDFSASCVYGVPSSPGNAPSLFASLATLAPPVSQGSALFKIPVFNSGSALRGWPWRRSGPGVSGGSGVSRCGRVRSARWAGGPGR